MFGFSWRELKPAHKRQISLLAMMVAFISIGVVAFSILNNQTAKSKSKSQLLDKNNGAPQNGVIATISMAAVDLANAQFKLHLTFQPVGNFSMGIDDLLNRPSQPVSIVFGSKIISFQAGVPMQSQDIAISLNSADTNMYPFDKFSSDLVLAGFTDVNIPSSAIKLGVNFQAGLQGWTFQPDFAEQPNSLSSICKISVSRSITTMFFSIFIVIGMWILSLSAFTLAFTLWFRNRKVEPPTIGLVASLLFALPAIRNSQPGVPTVGATVDLAGFMWNMFLVLTAAVMLIWNYIVKYTKEKSSPMLGPKIV
ncbi:hypothetical protein EDD86DRAFT_249278 [Gorgonomyces haynaldii]|nr:hypothetical protein EDD86DRAFT_249278 [Gorgonomyces haynaldii]